MKAAARAALVIFAPCLCMLFLPGLPRPSYSCSCAERLLGERFDTADAVFAGQVVDKSEIPGGYDVVFSVDRYWKGLSENDKVVTVWTVSSGASCGYSFQEGEEYLTYASNGNESLEVGLCGGTRPLAQAGSDLAVLGAGVVPLDIYPRPHDEVIVDYWIDPASVLLVAAVIGLSASLAVVIIRKPKH